MTEVKHKLGENVYMVTDKGSVFRTIVSELRAQEKYNYGVMHDHNDCFRSFSFVEATKKAAKILSDREKQLSRELDLVRSQIRRNGSPTHEQELLRSELAVKSPTGFLSDSTIAHVQVPKDYLLPGQAVYGVVGNKTHTGGHGSTHHVLQTTISSVKIDANGKLQYHYANHHYFPAGYVFTDVESAKKKLVEVFAEDTNGTLPIEKVKVVLLGSEQRADTVLEV